MEFHAQFQMANDCATEALPRKHGAKFTAPLFLQFVFDIFILFLAILNDSILSRFTRILNKGFISTHPMGSDSVADISDSSTKLTSSRDIMDSTPVVTKLYSSSSAKGTNGSPWSSTPGPSPNQTQPSPAPPTLQSTGDGPGIVSAVTHSMEQPSQSAMDLERKLYIVYLEPDRQSPFYQSILKFFRESQLEFGLNEAQMYHPHCSMTGFFELPHQLKSVSAQGRRLSAADLLPDFNDVCVQILDELIQEYQKHSIPDTGSYTYSRVVDIDGIRRPSHAPHSLSIGLTVCDDLKQMMIRFRDQVQYLHDFVFGPAFTDANNPSSPNHPILRHPYHAHLKHHSHPLGPQHMYTFIKRHEPFKIRPKPMDHISLAYSHKLGKNGAYVKSPELHRATCGQTEATSLTVSTISAESESSLSSSMNLANPAVPGSMILTNEILERLQSLANGLIPISQEMKQIQWSVVFYEVPFRSEQLGVPHEFREIRRWNL